MQFIIALASDKQKEAITKTIVMILISLDPLKKASNLLPLSRSSISQQGFRVDGEQKNSS